MTRYGAIEAGGTKFVCIVAESPDSIIAETRFPTTSPAETLGKAITFFKENGPLRSIGIAGFGPLDLDPASPHFGFVTATPKPGWSFTDELGIIQQALQIPAALDTDVNAAALGESLWGAGKGLANVVYFTIGTGIGGGCTVNGKPLHGLIHPEMGHMRIPHNHQTDPFDGICPFHQDCFEGLASGTAIHTRFGAPAETLPPDHPAWALEAKYIALALHNIICTHSPQKIILGGGVMQQTHLFPLVRKNVQTLLNNYVLSPQITIQIDDYIVPPALGNRAGVLGGLALALQLCPA